MKQNESFYRDKKGNRVKCRDSYTVRIKILDCPFQLSRKRNRFYKTRYRHERVITKIEPIGGKRVKCITVDNGDGSFLCTRDYIVTHNSSTQIRKCIHWATEPSIWPSIWSTTPAQFWYLYPNRDTVKAEFELKWTKEFMPRGSMKTDSQYGWRIETDKGVPKAIYFNTGVVVFFKTYTQDVHNLQSGTVHAIFTDEELPINHYDELMFRLTATDGIFHQVFTATRGQEFWRRAMECRGTKIETLKDAFKQQVSMYDCLEYMDGSPTPWNKEKIERVKRKCKSQNEIDKRVYGKFVLTEGLKYESFNYTRNYVEPYKIPKDWFVYSGVDIGSGGPTGHPAAVAFVAVRNDFKKGAVFRGWRGGVERTTSYDILKIYRHLRGDLKPTAQFYDHSAADFLQYAIRLNETFTAAEKSHEIGEDTLNTLFQHQMLDIFDIEELQPLSAEFSTLLKETPKRKAKDDFIDAVRYAVTKIPWDFSNIQTSLINFPKPEKREKTALEKRRELVFGDGKPKIPQDIQEEIDFYNELNEGDWSDVGGY